MKNRIKIRIKVNFQKLLEVQNSAVEGRGRSQWRPGRSNSTFKSSRIRFGSAINEKLDPDLDPHRSEKLDPDPHLSVADAQSRSEIKYRNLSLSTKVMYCNYSTFTLCFFGSVGCSDRCGKTG
jgi:hypothetical protein